MPVSTEFSDRLYPSLTDIAEHFGTPFHIYDEEGIHKTGELLKDVFSGIEGFKEFFAVKALPNPRILRIMKEMGFGFDCSSTPELHLARAAGGTFDDIMFTSNNTSGDDFSAAAAGDGSILNLDDISLIAKVGPMPELICFRYNPGARRTGNEIIGNPLEAKYGVTHDQLVDAYAQAKKAGAKRFGIHTMLASNELNYSYMVETAKMLLEMVEKISVELDIEFDFINIGGGLGIPYRPEDSPLDIASMGREITLAFDSFKEKNGYAPRFFMESGRYMTGPHGMLVTKVINHKHTYRNYVGVDASMAALMRPGMYGAYHHIDAPGKDDSAPKIVVDVTGSLCENNDKFAVQRSLPELFEGDLLAIHDTGAHGHAMGFNYNGTLRPQELLFKRDGSVDLIRRAETMDDYFATLSFEQNHLDIKK